MRTLFLSSIAVCLALPLPAAVQQGLEPIERELAHQIAKRLCETADKTEKPQIKIDADTDKANGVHSPGKLGVLIVPQKDLKEGEELEAKLKTDKGAAVGYLFLYHLVPVIDGKTVDPSRLRSIKITDDNGVDHVVYFLLLAGKQVAEEDYRLHAYGHDAKPLVDAKFAEGTGPGTDPVSVEVKDANEQTQQGKLVVTVFGKYQASFQLGYKAD